MSVESDILALQQTWSSDASNNGTVTIDAAAISAKNLAPCTGFDDLVSQYLLVSSLVVTTSSVPAPDGTTITFQGTAAVFGASPNLTLSTITVFADTNGTTNLSIVISPAPLSAIFPAFAGDPFDVLTLTSPAVLFTTAATATLPWNGESVTISQGLQYQSVLNETEGPLAPIASLLGITSTSSPVLSGAIVPTPVEVGSTSIVYPVATLTASLSSEASFTLGSLVFDQAQIVVQSVIDPVYGPASVLSLGVTVSAGSTSFAISAILASNLSSICLNVVPAAGFGYSDIVALLNNDDSFTSVIPADLTSVFPTTGLSLQSFGAMVGLDPLALQSLMVTIGTTQTWTAGPFSASNLGMTVSVFAPLSSSPQLVFYFQGQITAFPSIFPDPFDIVVAIGSGGVIVSAAYSGTVSLGVSDIMSALSPDNSINVPTSLVPPLSFSDFRIVVEDTASTGFILYASGGEDDGSTPPPKQWTVLGQPIDIDVSVYIDTTQTPGLFSVTGSMTLDEQIFDLQVTFSGSDFSLSASWQAAGNSPVTLTGLATDLGLTLPEIPAALNNGLALTGASVAYDSTGTFVLTAESQYGQAVLVAFDPQGQEATAYAFLIQLNPISLSDLPIVGPELGAVASAGVQDIALIIAPQAITDATTISQINAAIPATYPQLPAGGVANEVTLVASMSFGGTPTPLQFALVGSGQSDGPAPAASPAPGPTWFPVQQTFGPLTIQKVGVEYDSTSSTLWFDIDASLAFGPLTLSLLGLGIGSPLTTFEPSFQLQGLGVSYANPPLQIAGTLINLEPASGIAFGGDVVLSTDALTMSAVGYYGDVTGFPSLFVFAYVAEDFGGPPAFFVTGVAAGFGFNSNVTLPTLGEVSSFPFLEYLTSQPFTGTLPSPATILQSLMQPASGPVWVAPSTGSLWLAAGITFTSFQLVNSRALLIVESGSELTITLLGTSAAQYPQPSTGQSPYAQLELELEASLVPSQGTFSVQGVLTPSSFLLDPKCVVTGGFAYDLWFGPSPYAGDFVLTIGGYNSAFAPPSWYPSVPPVGFQWALGSISITGDAYLALTPAVFMVGGSLDATYQSGALRAWFDVWADVIVQWSPFYVNATLGLTIGASYTLDLLFTRKTISVELGCSLEIWGPPTGGNATVYWWVFSFSFAFGAGQGSAASTTWADVESMLPGGSSQSGSLALQASGLLAFDSNGWVVSPTTFGFTATTAIPATTVLLNASQVGTGDPFNIALLDPPVVGAISTLAVTISPSVAFTTSIIQANVPSALWGTASSSVPSGTAQLIPNQTVGLALTLAPPAAGSSAGAIPASVLGPTAFAAGGLPLSTSATPEGDVPAESSQTVSTIESTVGDSFPRGAIFAALQPVCPVAFDDSLDGLAEEAGCWLYAQPLLVPATTNGDAS